MQNKTLWICAVAALFFSTVAGSAVYPLADDFAALPTDSWLKSGGNLFNQNYSPLTQVNRQSVIKLKGVWRARLDGSGTNAKYSGEAQPMAYSGGNLFAGAQRGDSIWLFSLKGTLEK